MGETHVQFIPDVTVQTNPLPYPRYIGEILFHPYLQNTLLEVLEVWDGQSEVWGNLNEPIPFAYGVEANPITRDWNNPPPRRDESSKYPIYKCRVNGAFDQWIIFKWILLDENRPTDLLGYSNIQVASGNAIPTSPVTPNLPITTTFRSLPIEIPISFSDSSYSLSVSDADASAVIAAIIATGVSLSSTQQTIIQTRIANAKSDGVWTKWRAYYGFVGGTAASHAINWKSPGAFTISWNGTLTHSTSGVKGSATGYGDTGISINTFAIGSVGLGYYLTDVVPVETAIQLGAGLAAGGLLELYFFSTQGYFYLGAGSNFVASTNNFSKQYFSGNNISGLTGKTYKNGVNVATATLVTATLPNRNLWILAANRDDGSFNSVSRLGSVSINTGLTDAQETANYISELAFQTALGRS